MATLTVPCTKEAIQLVERRLDLLAGQRCCLYEKLRFYSHEMAAEDILSADAALADIDRAEGELDDQLAVMMASPAGLALAAEYQQAQLTAHNLDASIPF